MDSNSINLLKLQTTYMQEDLTTRAMCAAITPQLQQVADELAKTVILANIDQLPEVILDELANELHIEWYDANAEINVKRALIKNSDKVHRYLGTPYAVEQVVQDFFGEGRVEEWFEYEGQPYCFRVITSNMGVTGDLASQFAQAVEKVKNARSRLEHVLISMSAEFNLYFGFVIHTGDLITVEQVV